MTTARLTKPALGVLMGASIALAASAVAGQAGSSWFSGSFATGGSGSAGADQALLAQTDAAMSAQLKADAENCDQLGIGASIRTATSTGVNCYEIRSCSRLLHLAPRPIRHLKNHALRCILPI